jgi:hypothetical protein
MKKLIVPAILLLIIFFAFQDKAVPPEWRGKPTYEYASVRFVPGGRTIIMWPDGTTDKLGDLNTTKDPDNVDERLYYLTLAVNLLAQKGFEPALIPSLPPDGNDVWMRRSLSK